jgi:hypothetical protein
VADVDAESFEKLLVYIYKGTVGLDAISIGQMLGLHSAGCFFGLAVTIGGKVE